MQKVSVFIIVSLYLIFFRVVIGKSQSSSTDFQTWADFTYTYHIDNKNQLTANFGIRGVVSKNEWNQLNLRVNYKHAFNRIIQATAGIMVFNTTSDIISNTSEIRLFEDATVAWPSFDYLKFYNRFRLEQRFFSYEDNTSNGGTLIPDDFSLRGRYQITFETIDVHLSNKNRPIYFLGGWEVFYPFNKETVESFINNQRIIGGIGHRISPNFKYEFHYILQKSRQFNEDGQKITEHIIRLKIFLLSNKPGNVIE